MTAGAPVRWVVTGARGMLGQDLLAALAGQEVVALDRTDADVTDPAAVATALRGLDERTVLVNCAAWTAVDDAETREAEAFAVNAVAPQLLATACAAAGARSIHVLQAPGRFVLTM